MSVSVCECVSVCENVCERRVCESESVLISNGSDMQNWYHDHGHMLRNNVIQSNNQLKLLIKKKTQ